MVSENEKTEFLASPEPDSANNMSFDPPRIPLEMQQMLAYGVKEECAEYIERVAPIVANQIMNYRFAYSVCNQLFKTVVTNSNSLGA